MVKTINERIKELHEQAEEIIIIAQELQRVADKFEEETK